MPAAAKTRRVLAAAATKGHSEADSTTVTDINDKEPTTPRTPGGTRRRLSRMETATQFLREEANNANVLFRRVSGYVQARERVHPASSHTSWRPMHHVPSLPINPERNTAILGWDLLLILSLCFWLR